jgi:hypothetical protein
MRGGSRRQACSACGRTHRHLDTRLQCNRRYADRWLRQHHKAQPADSETKEPSSEAESKTEARNRTQIDAAPIAWTGTWLASTAAGIGILCWRQEVPIIVLGLSALLLGFFSRLKANGACQRWRERYESRDANPTALRTTPVGKQESKG